MGFPEDLSVFIHISVHQNLIINLGFPTKRAALVALRPTYWGFSPAF